MASAPAAEAEAEAEISYKKVGPYLVDTDIDRALGSTYGAQVFAGKHATSGEKVAAKLVTWGKLAPHDMIDTEVDLMRQLPPHENTVKFYDYIKKDMGETFQLWIMLEKCDLGDLEKFSTTQKLDVKKTLDLFLQAAKGLQHIHANKLVHRDIKLKNILVHGTKDNPVVKIADFGVSRVIQGKSTNMTMIGTESTMAPELFKDGKEGKTKAGQEVDTFSLAVSILSILDPQDASTEYKGECLPPRSSHNKIDI
jgi:serine/threonine protein kinase